MSGIVALSGGLGFPSTTTALTDLVGARLTERTGEPVTTIEIRDLASEIVDATLLGLPGPRLDAALRAVEQADVVVTATPVFRGSYAGLYKAFWDLVDPVAMRGKTVVLGATGGSTRHQLMIDQAMRPLFAYFGALVVPTAVYAATEDWNVGGTATAALADRAERAADQALALASVTASA